MFQQSAFEIWKFGIGLFGFIWHFLFIIFLFKDGSTFLNKLDLDCILSIYNKPIMHKYSYKVFWHSSAVCEKLVDSLQSCQNHLGYFNRFTNLSSTSSKTVILFSSEGGMTQVLEQLGALLGHRTTKTNSGYSVCLAVHLQPIRADQGFCIYFKQGGNIPAIQVQRRRGKTWVCLCE